MNWNDFFPSYLIFKIGFILVDLKINVDFIFFRGDQNSFYNYLKELTIKKINNQNILDLKFIENKITDNDSRRFWYLLVSKEYFRTLNYEGAIIYLNRAIEIANNLVDEIDEHTYNPIKSRALKNISIELANQQKIVEALDLSNSIDDLEERIAAKIKISGVFFDNGFRQESKELLDQTLEFIYELTKEWKKKSFLIAILKEIIRQGDFTRSIEIFGSLDYEIQSNCYAELAKLHLIQSQSEDAEKYLDISINVAMNISEVKKRTNVFKGIIETILEQNQFDKAKYISHNYLEGLDRIYSLIKIAQHLYVKNIYIDAKKVLDSSYNLMQEIKEGYDKNLARRSLAQSYASQGDLKTALLIAGNQFDTIKEIVIELANKQNWQLAEITGLKILETAVRHNCWKEIAEKTSKEKGWLNTVQLINLFQSTEAKTFFLKGLADAIKLIGAKKELILKSRYYYQDDIESIEKLLQQHALHELFFNNATPEKIERFNRSLNIQWAIDIKNSFSVN